MQLKYLLTGALLPLGLFASPTPEPEAAAEAVPEVFDSAGQAQSLNERAIVRPQHCVIVGDSTYVNCRRGPATKWSVERRLRRGEAYDFWCVRSGECVTIDGFRNCGWHYSRQLDCYVSGHYTSNACTLARLGGCGGADDDDAADPFP
ncbi:hypothetical protein VTI28DRAFT_4470 [Corynascus sepedonium]